MHMIYDIRHVMLVVYIYVCPPCLQLPVWCWLVKALLLVVDSVRIIKRHKTCDNIKHV